MLARVKGEPTGTARPLRIAHLGKYYAPVRGGIERVTQDLAQWQVAHGHAVTVLVHQRPGVRTCRTEEINGVEVRRVGCWGAPMYTPISPSWPRALARMLAEFNPDIIHVQMPNPWSFFLLASRAARRVPWVVHWQADVTATVPDWRVRMAYQCYRPLERAFLRRAAAIAVTSQAYGAASAVLSRCPERLHVIPIGITPLREPPGQHAIDAARALWPCGAGMRLLAVGRLSYYKGFDTLLEALADVGEGVLLIVGDGDGRDALRRQAQAAGIDARVRFADHVDEATLMAAYAAADVLVLPSRDRSESFGVVQLEAMRAGTAVIASDVPGSGVGSVAEHGVSGLHVPPGDSVALGAAIGRLTADRALCRRMGAAGQRRWQARFTLDRSARAFMDLYQQLHRQTGDLDRVPRRPQRPPFNSNGESQ